MILTCGEDYLLNLIDLKSDKQDDYIDSTFNAPQPLRSCGFIPNTSYSYCVTNVNTLLIIDLESMTQVKEYKDFPNNVTYIISA